MTNISYREQLESVEWADKRKKILKRDNYQCVKCSSKKNLQVHHKKYIRGRMCWEYPAKLLVTLCRICHDQVHKTEKIEVITPKRGAKPKPKKKIVQAKIITSTQKTRENLIRLGIIDGNESSGFGILRRSLDLITKT